MKKKDEIKRITVSDIIYLVMSNTGMTQEQAARELRVSNTVVKRLIHERILPAKHVVECAPWIIERKGIKRLFTLSCVDICVEDLLFITMVFIKNLLPRSSRHYQL